MRFRESLGSVCRVETEEPLVALTFDDGPCEINTPAVLEVLRERDVRATFFVVGKRARLAPDVVRAVVAAGHEIGVHGRNHLDLTRASVVGIYRDLVGGRRLVEDAAAVDVDLFRPPYGTQDHRTLLVGRSVGLRSVSWSASPRDFLELTIDQHLCILRAEIGRGGIVLLHDGLPRARERRVEMVQAVLDLLDELSLTPTTVGDLLARGRPFRRKGTYRRAAALGDEMSPLLLPDELD